MREDAQSRRWTWPRRILGPTLVVAAIAVGTGVGARAWFDTRDDLDRASAALATTRSELAETRDDVAAAIAHLRAERAALRTGLVTLDRREGERNAAEGALTMAKKRLAERRAELAAATADLADRENQLEGLDRCVRGVVAGLNQAAVGDIAGLDATLAGIDDTCGSAGASL